MILAFVQVLSLARGISQYFDIPRAVVGTR